MIDHKDVLAAFLDDEPVEASALSAALADADAREHFIDLLVLRGLVGDAAQPRLVAGDATRAHVAPAARRHTTAWLAAAAALVIAGTAAGYLTGRSGLSAAPPIATPLAGVVATSSAPAPTHVIRLENGVNWNERSGGN